jgi:hypothetical protein
MDLSLGKNDSKTGDTQTAPTQPVPVFALHCKGK